MNHLILWKDIRLFIGQNPRSTTGHSHPVVQFVVAINGDFKTKVPETGKWITQKGLLIKPNHQHQCEATDVAMRYGYYPFAPKIPFVPGYEILGKVTAVGSAVNHFNMGDTVAALTVYGGYSEYIYLEEENMVAVPKNVSPDEAVAVILNYCTAYQILHRVLQVKKGDKVLITGASGGVGSALLDLGKLAGLLMYGTASTDKHTLIKEQGEFYGISASYKKDKTNIHKDMESLFNMLKDRKIKPIISERFPILEAAKANTLLETGKISGKIVLVAPELN